MYRSLVLTLEEGMEKTGWDAPPMLIEVRGNEVGLVGAGEHPVVMMVELFQRGWRPEKIVVAAESYRTMQFDEASMLPEWNTLPTEMKQSWVNTMLTVPPSQMKPFVVEMRTVAFVSQDVELMLVRDRGGLPEWAKRLDGGVVTDAARAVVRGVAPQV
jgi:hypothetical protein